MTPEGAAAMANIIKTLLRRADSVDFRGPVDWQGLGLEDYPQVIAKPMWLDLVEYKIETQHYITVEQCADDIRLIWDNCKRYNGEGSDFYKIADRLSKRFEELFSKVKPETKKRGREPASAADAGQAWRAAQAKKLRKSINDVAADLVCPITQELPFDPVMAEDGHGRGRGRGRGRGPVVPWAGRAASFPGIMAAGGFFLIFEAILA